MSSQRKPDRKIYIPPNRRFKEVSNASKKEKIEVEDELADKLNSLVIDKKTNYFDASKYGHLLEMSDFDMTCTTADIYKYVNMCTEQHFFVKWVDDGHCLVVFSSTAEAVAVLNTPGNFPFQLCEMKNACMESKNKVLFAPGDWAQPYKKRPETDSSTAHRLIYHHLGMCHRSI